MKTFKQIQEQTHNKSFGRITRFSDDSGIYKINDVPEEEFAFFVRVVELLRSGIEYQKLLDDEYPHTEGYLNEDINLFMVYLRKNIRSGRKYSFKEWIAVFSEMLDALS